MPRAPDASRLLARRPPASQSSSVLSPDVYFGPEIRQQLLVADERIRSLSVADMAVIPLAAFVVIAQHACTRHDERKAILEAVSRSLDRLRNPPDDDFDEGIL